MTHVRVPAQPGRKVGPGREVLRFDAPNGNVVGPRPANPIRLALFYDMDACRQPTGVTRHALGQLGRLASRDDVRLTLISGKMSESEGLDLWASLGDLSRHELPIRTRNALRWWRVSPWPTVERWSGPVDWVYCPAEYHVSSRNARLAVTSHDVLQDLRFEAPARRDRLARTFARADLILSVSRYNTDRLLEAFPGCEGRIALVPNAADDLFFETATEPERAGARADLGLPPGVPYLLSVANFQMRKNLPCLIRAFSRLPEAIAGELALVLLGEGCESETLPLRNAIAAEGRGTLIRLPGYRQGKALRAAYAEATALVFPSLCESFGIPVVEAMAQGVPVALADSTALPEIGGLAGWYFDPGSEGALAATLRALLDQPGERARRVGLGREIASYYRWKAVNDLLVAALASHDAA